METGVGNEQGGERLHSLDAMRAFMMLLGILLHVSWFFIPIYVWHPITDIGAGDGHFAFFHWVHTFRMQAFMFVAGFFGHLVLSRYGFWGFLRHRLVRVGIPLVVATPVIGAWMHTLVIKGGMLSGRIQTDGTLWTELAAFYKTTPFTQQLLRHLWFLYHLLVLYAVMLVIVYALHLLDRRGNLRRTGGAWLARILGSPAALLLLAIPVGVAVWDHPSWLGIVSGYTLIVNWTGLLCGYLPFFAIGWFIYSHRNLLAVADRRWPIYLGTGTIIALATWGGYAHIMYNGEGTVFPPAFAPQEIRDYPALRSSLLAAEEEEADSISGRAWERLAPPYRRAVRQMESMTTDQKAGLGMALSSSVLASPDLARPQDCADVPLSPMLAATCRQGPGERHPGLSFALNRRLLEATFAGALYARIDVPEAHADLKPLYGYAYGLAGWLLTFGFLGYFRRYWSRPSKRFRYIADSSYWLYILHLPLLFHVQIVISQWQIPWPVKYVIYLTPVLALLLLTYHYLVRSTFIGVILNGRRYPFVPLFTRRPAAPPITEAQPEPVTTRQTDDP